MSNLNRGSSIDVSYQVSVHLAKQFQRTFLEIRNNNCLWLLGFRREDFLGIDKNSTCRSCLLTDRDEMSNLYRGLSINATYQVSAHLAKRFQKRSFFRNRPIRNKNCLWRPCLLTNKAEMNNLYRGPSIYASYQVSVHLARRFQRRILEIDQPETITADGYSVSEQKTFYKSTNKNCLWWPCLLADRDEMNNLYRGFYIDASYQVAVHWVKGFQRRRLKCEKFTDGRRRIK